MKLKIWVLQGLPGSGKSTVAKQIISENKNTFRINKDSLRNMLYFEDFNPKYEKMIHLVNEALIEQILSLGNSVVVDNMNLGESNINAYKIIANKHDAEIEIIKVFAPVQDCIDRDNKRKALGQRGVGKNTILNLAFRYNILRSQNNAVVSDLDGTLCDVTKRCHLVNKKNGLKPDWDEFSRQSINDEPRLDIIEQVKRHQANGLDLIIVSGCSEEYRDIREQWLTKYEIYPDRFIMRPAHDTRPDTVIKKYIIDNFLDKSKIKYWLDDRVCIVNLLREEGINVIDVGDGTFL